MERKRCANHFGNVFSKLKRKRNELVRKMDIPDKKIRSGIMNRKIQIPKITLNGDGKTAIILCGSYGYSFANELVKGIKRKQYEINGEVPIYLLTKNKQADMGQPLNDDVRKILEGIVHIDVSEIEIPHSILNADVYEFVRGMKLLYNRIILIGALGKSFSSRIMPLICLQALNVDINVSAVCVKPFLFESSGVKEVADISFDVINTLCRDVFRFELIDEGRYQDEKKLSFEKQQEKLSFDVVEAVKSVLEKDKEVEHVCYYSRNSI